MANLATNRGRSAFDARTEAAAARALDARRGRGVIAPSPRAGRFTSALIAPLIKGAKAGLADLRRAWPEIVGTRLAALTHPEKLQNGQSGDTLVVVAHASAAPFVQHQQGLIIERANLAGAHIARLQIRQGAAPARAGKPANPVAPPAPLAADREEAIATELASVHSPALRAALLRLARALA